MTIAADLDQALRSSGLLSTEEIDRADTLSRERRIPLPRAAVALGLLAEDQFLWLAADSAGMELASPTEETVDAELIARVPIEELQRFTALPLVEEDDRTVVIAFSEPPSNAVLTRLSQYFGTAVRPMLASAPRLRRILGRLESNRGDTPRRAASQDPTGVTAFYRHLTSGLGLGASEVRFEPTAKALRIRYRRNGALRVVETEPAEIAPAVAARARMIGGLEQSSGPETQTATRRMKLGDKSVRFELSIVPVRDGDLVIVRALPWVDLPETLADWPAFGEAADWLRREFVSPGGANGWVRVQSDDLELESSFVRAVATAADETGLAVGWYGARAPIGPWTVVTTPHALRAARPDLVIVDARADLFALDPAGAFDPVGALAATQRVLVIGRLSGPALENVEPRSFVADVTCTTKESPDRAHAVSATVTSLRGGRS